MSALEAGGQAGGVGSVMSKLSFALSDNETLPVGWVWSNLDDVSQVIAGNPAPQGAEFFKDGKYAFVRVQDMGRLGSSAKLIETNDYVNDKATDKLKLIPKGSVLFTKSGASTLLNQRAILAKDMYVVSHIAAAIPEEGVKSEWIYYWMKTVDFNYLAHATTLPSLPLSKAKAIPFPLAPYNEQKRIVAEIEKQFSRLDEATAALKRIKANLKRYKASVLKAAVEGKLTEGWRKQHADVEPTNELLKRILAERRKKWEEAELEKMKAKGKEPKDDKWKKKYKNLILPDVEGLPNLPTEWEWVTWEAILDYEKSAFKRGPFGSSLKKSIFVKSGYKVYEQYCPINDDCSFARYFITKEKFKEMDAFSVKARDFLISCSGVTLGRITQVPDEYEEGVINQALLRVRVNNNIINGAFFKMLFRSPYFQKQIFDNATGTAIPNVKGVNDLKAIPLPLPPLEEQKVIISVIEGHMSVVIEIEKQIDAGIKHAVRLRQSILKKAFSGKLVKQDQGDKPTNKLIDAIKLEKEKVI